MWFMALFSVKIFLGWLLRSREYINIPKSTISPLCMCEEGKSLGYFRKSIQTRNMVESFRPHFLCRETTWKLDATFSELSKVVKHDNNNGSLSSHKVEMAEPPKRFFKKVVQATRGHLLKLSLHVVGNKRSFYQAKLASFQGFFTLHWFKVWLWKYCIFSSSLEKKERDYM